MPLSYGNGLLEKIIEIGIAIEIENNCNPIMFDPDPDFDPGKGILEAIEAKINDIGLYKVFGAREIFGVLWIS